MAGSADETVASDLATDEGNAVWRLLASYYRSHVHYLVASVVATLAARLLWLYPPVLLGVAFDALLVGDRPFRLPFVPAGWIPATEMGQFWFTLAGFVVAYAGGSAVYALGGLARNLAAYRVQHDVRTDVYARTQALDFAFFEGERTGELMSVLNNDVNQLEDFLKRTLAQAANSTFIVVGVGFYMSVLNPQLAVVAFAAPVLALGVNYAYSRYIEPRHAKVRSRVGDINARIENNVAGIGIVKAYNRESFEAERVADASAEYRAGMWEVARSRVLFSQATTVLTYAGYVLVFLVGGYWILAGPPPLFSGSLAGGTLLTFLVYNRQFSQPVVQLTGIVDSYQQTNASSARILGLVDEDSRLSGGGDGDDVGDVTGRVAFDDVTFTYDGSDEPTLSDLAFDAEPGDMVGVVGPTGAGKSTVVKLLLRFYDVDEGAVRVDGRDVRDLDPSSLRDAVGYVEQEPFLFDGTVRENVAYGKPGADRDAVEAAARRAGAHEFVRELDDGYDTQVGERGVRLSGGQRQRLALARAILSDPDVLVLDEATSHVDNETEMLIQRSLDDLRGDRTAFVVAHRLSTVCDADKILVLDDGEIVERGTHEELLAADGVYANLWRVQVGDVEELPEEFVRHAARGG